jgi:hypothetical protein
MVGAAHKHQVVLDIKDLPRILFILSASLGDFRGHRSPFRNQDYLSRLFLILYNQPLLKSFLYQGQCSAHAAKPIFGSYSLPRFILAILLLQLFSTL